VAPKSPRKEGGQFIVEFAIQKDRAVASVRPAGPVSDTALGDLSIHAVEESGRFPALPIEFSGQQLAIRMRFEYDPQPTAEPQKH
jgi:hypothetical protein